MKTAVNINPEWRLELFHLGAVISAGRDLIPA